MHCQEPIQHLLACSPPSQCCSTRRINMRSAEKISSARDFTLEADGRSILPDSEESSEEAVTEITSPVHRQSGSPLNSAVASSTPRSTDFRATKFADKHKAAHWFLGTEQDQADQPKTATKRSHALMLQAAIITTVLPSNICLTIFAMVRYLAVGGVGVVYEGACSTVKDLDLWIHLLVNMLGAGMLSTSNYCMQLQAVPTRADVDRAHYKGTWLDIGVPSVRNLRYIGGWRRVSWLLLAASSLPIHLMYVGPLPFPPLRPPWQRVRQVELDHLSLPLVK